MSVFRIAEKWIIILESMGADSGGIYGLCEQSDDICSRRWTMLDLDFLCILVLKVIYHPLYGMNNYVLIWGDWLSCNPLRGSHDS